jgi:rod shape determining protein RodA
MQYSITQSGLPKFSDLWKKQLIRIGIGLAAMTAVFFASHNWIYNLAYPIYVIGLTSLAGVIIFGRFVRGVQRWFEFGPLSIQPSELAKIILIIAIARYLYDRRKRMQEPKVIFGVLMMSGAYILLILMQPNFGTAFIFIPVTLAILLVSGANLKYLVGLVFPIVTAATTLPFLLTYNWKPEFSQILIYASVYFIAVGFIGLIANNRQATSLVFWIAICILAGFSIAWVGNTMLPDYPKERLASFLSPETDALDTGYQVIQSRIAIGSGGLLGQGYLQGKQKNLAFIPEQHNDFIFAVIGEEWGFLGISVLLLLYLALLWRGMRIASEAENLFSCSLAVGVIALIGTQTFINIGMTLGIAPVTGLPLPLLSYGGSSMLSSLMAMGLLMNVRRRPI